MSRNHSHHRHVQQELDSTSGMKGHTISGVRSLSSWRRAKPRRRDHRVERDGFQKYVINTVPTPHTRRTQSTDRKRKNGSVTNQQCAMEHVVNKHVQHVVNLVEVQPFQIIETTAQRKSPFNQENNKQVIEHVESLQSQNSVARSLK